jgi:ISXO2 transposase-like protein/transposase-like zinc ribbon protein
MTQHSRDDLWRDFPKTATEFERRFATEADCRAYWIEARWGGKPACARCGSTYVWALCDGTTFECRECDHQTSLTSGTLLEKTHKPLKMWFRAVFEISTRRTGISAMDLMRIMGFGSYKTAWTWLHKLRSALARPEREPLGPFVQMDEALVGGKGGPNKELVLVAAEAGGRVRLAHADNNDQATLKRFADGEVASDARIVTDGHAGYSGKSLGKRPHEAKVQTKAERRESDAVQACHWTISLLKRWLLGTHAGAVAPKHLQAYLDEYAFRHNRRKTNGVGRIAARVIEQLVARPPLTMRSLIDDTSSCRWFRQPELTA